MYPYGLGSGNVALAFLARELGQFACYVPLGWRISDSRARQARAGRAESPSVEGAHVIRSGVMSIDLCLLDVVRTQFAGEMLLFQQLWNL